MSICPFMSMPVPFKHDDGSSDIEMHFQECLEHKCQFWIQVYTTESRGMSGCGVPLKANMNAEGLFVV